MQDSELWSRTRMSAALVTRTPSRSTLVKVDGDARPPAVYGATQRIDCTVKVDETGQV